MIFAQVFKWSIVEAINIVTSICAGSHRRSNSSSLLKNVYASLTGVFAVNATTIRTSFRSKDPCRCYYHGFALHIRLLSLAFSLCVCFLSLLVCLLVCWFVCLVLLACLFVGVVLVRAVFFAMRNIFCAH